MPPRQRGELILITSKFQLFSIITKCIHSFLDLKVRKQIGFSREITSAGKEGQLITYREAINSSRKYSTINRSTTIKSGSSSSSHTPLQPRLQHSLTAGVNLWDKSGLTLQNRCALSDPQEMCHHLKRNVFKPNQRGTASPNEVT
jgi:hypothetical protein